MMNSKISRSYLIVDGVLILLSLYMGGLWLLNTQVAFICSMLILFASFLSYRGLVQKRLENEEFSYERDELDAIDDKHELFEEEPQVKELSAAEIKKVLKEEKANNSGLKNSFLNLFKTLSGALSVYRLLAYGILCIAILVLINKSVFEPFAFLLGLSVLPLGTVFAGFTSDKN